MRVWRRLAIGLTAFLLLLSLTACGKSGSDPQGEPRSARAIAEELVLDYGKNKRFVKIVKSGIKFADLFR